MRICVTGSAGLIGSHLVQAIEQRWPEAFVQQIDLKTGYDCREFFAKDDGEWDLALHCAAVTGGIEGTMFNSALQAATNSELDGAYFQWAFHAKPKRIVYISSSCAYPVELSNNVNYGLREFNIDFDGDWHDPDMPYGWAKLNGEVMANAVRDSGIAVSIVRPFAIYGESQETCRMIPAFVERAMSDADTMTVWGPGDQASDFMHASDCANAILTMADQDIDGPVNLGTGRGATADEVAEMVMAEVGVNREIVHNLDKPFGPKWRVADPKLLHTFYKPTVSLEEGVARVVAAHR